MVLACTVDEEFTHIGSSRLATDGVVADLGIVAEPTRLDLVVAHKGAVRWKILTRGVACHSSSPGRGVNAIYRMGDGSEGAAGARGRAVGAEARPVGWGSPSLRWGESRAG